MEACSDLQVDVNGEETIFLSKKIICEYSGKFKKLLGKSNCSERNLKVIFNDFPGGAESFELVSRFCYNNGRFSVTPSNVVLLHCAAKFMEVPDLLEQTEKSMDEIRFWTWPDLLAALKQCQDLKKSPESDPLAAKFMDSLVGKLNLTVEASPSSASASSPDSSLFRFSCDSKSTESFKNSSARGTWWFDELLVLGPDLFETLVKIMVSHKFDHFIITRFLLYYQKAKFCSANLDEKRKILETTLDTLYVLDRSCVSCKTLFGILRIALGLKNNIESSSMMSKLENMIGNQLDQATLDNLLVPSPYRSNQSYNVNLILRFTKSFLDSITGGFHVQPQTERLKKVSNLIDLYIAEVAPDPCLKPSKFLALVTAIPDSARESHDEIYRAIDMYLEAHIGLTESEKLKIIRRLSYEKLSSESRAHISHNRKFPAAERVISQKLKLKTSTDDSPGEALNLRLEKMEISGENEKLKEHLQGIQWRVMELERACRKMQNQMEIMKKISKSTRRGNTRSLPKLCS
ncbi:PREDICTED: BTB/POZ domain-containing protein At3g22104-like isoform X2 [Tarenaya hassleriana]|uniref:BTB/POZ domain-containing protein At3g22104-like isoform X2 n=1 Tax=Tarenaya hassleriana TaxID=28532 RepID=UPI00053C6B26|nr:PREDICTED: BTB/POZ domain-containing protein At3g22104-like isoform X2 [Tarenaya hassleriana]